MEVYDQAVSRILNEVGAKPLMKANAESVLIGDGRKWSELRLTRFPSHRAFRDADN